MAIRVFNYTPGYPISYGSGSTETQNTAWSKVVLEFERIYRFINEGFNYFERNIQDIRDIISGGTGTVTDEMVCPVGSIIAYSGLLGSIPSNWHICDGTDGTPDLRDRFLKGTANAGDVNKYVSAGLPNITGEYGPIQHINAHMQGSSGALDTPGTRAPYGNSIWGNYTDIQNQNIGGQGYFRISFDASKSNPIYGNSDTVMPNSYIVYYIMRMS